MEKLKVRIENSVDKVSLLENISYYILLAAAFLLPVFFIPSPSFQFQFSKIVLISLAALVSFALWLVARLKDGRYLLPNSIVFLFAGAVLFVTLLATLFSPALMTSFIGQGSEVGTWANFLVLFLVLFLYSALFRPKERVFYLYLALFSSAILIVLFHALRFAFGAQFLSFGIFTNITSNLIGKWNDLGIFFGLVALLSLMTVGLMRVSRFFKIVLWIIFALSVVSLSIVNFPTLWYVLAAFSLLYFVYTYALGKEFDASDAPAVPRRKRIRGSAVAVFLILLSLVFLFDYYQPNQRLGAWISGRFGVSQLEVRPNWSSTVSVAEQTLLAHPLLGVGPNRFVDSWLQYKPPAVNQTAFWSTNFSSGVGFLPTQAVTTGALGLLAWIAFLVSIAYVGLKFLLTPITDRIGRYLSVSSFFASLYLWTFFIFYIPSAVILVLTFLFTGVFLASLYNERLLKPRTISFGEEPRTGFVSVLVLSAFLVGVVALSYLFGVRFIASAYYQNAVQAFNVGDTAQAGAYIQRAVSLSDQSAYDRLLTELSLVKLNDFISTMSAHPSADQIQQFRNLMGDAVRYARAAVDSDQTDYQNWIELGRVYEAVVPPPLSVQGAYASAKSAYDTALALDPQGPDVRLMEARLALANNDTKTALSEVDKALAMKSNYTDGVFLLSYIQAAEGKLKDAIASAKSAATLAPDDPTVFFQLGLLEYNDADYQNAVAALERAVRLVPHYANAEYYLGLSYDKLGRTADALAQFDDIKTLNPDNAEIPVIIGNIKAGRDPFASVSAAKQPSGSDALPVQEQTSL